MRKKKLDELFQDKFLDFKEPPDEKVWLAIEASLNKKKKKKGIPMWWQIGGIAAALAVGLYILNPFSEVSPNPQIMVDSPKKIETQETIRKNSNHGADEVIINGKIDAYAKDEVTKTIPADAIQEVAEKGEEPSESSAYAKDNGSFNNGSEYEGKEEAIATTSQKTKGNPIATSPQKNAAVRHAPNSNEDNSLFGNPSSNEKNDFETTVAETDPLNGALEHKNPSIDPSKTPNNKDAIEYPKEKNGIAAQDQLPKLDVLEKDKKSIFEEIENQEEVALAQEKTKNKWSAGPSIAPVYFNAIGEGSPVHSIFVPNSKSGNINLSYGVSVAYAVSGKLSIRSGIHKVDFGYDTQEVAFSSSLTAVSSRGQLGTIDYAPTSKSLIVSSNKVTSANFSTENTSLDVSAQSATRNGFMSQQLGYLELPVEVNYAVLDTKFGINLIGGFSSLFLLDNAVSLTAGELTTEIGEANNINDLNFSANMGIGLNYKFSSQLRLNVEPIFKYQLNTFSEIDGTFRPYSIGVYSGLSFKF